MKKLIIIAGILYLISMVFTVFSFDSPAEGTSGTSTPTPPPPSVAWVDDNYTSGSCGGHNWNYDAFDTIQEGINAVSGSTVHVAEGYYRENIVIKDNLQLLGASSAATIIDGMQAGSVITATNLGNTTRVEGFTVTNGSATFGGGINNSNASPIITNCVFTNNSAADSGGGMFNDQSSPTVTNCTFQSNSASGEGGGIYNKQSSSPVISGCTLNNNSAPSGGGMTNYQSSPTVSNCAFTGNPASSQGGGMTNYQSLPTIANCTFQNNSASGGGATGGGMHNDASSPNISNCTFTNNSVFGEGASGGGMHNDASSPNISGCTFTNNSANSASGNNAFGGGIYSRTGSLLTIGNSTFNNNSADFTGGGLQVIDSVLNMSNCNVSYSRALSSDGGGIRMDNSSATVIDCTFYNNSATGDAGGIDVILNSTLNITGCSLFNNSANSTGGGIRVYSSSVTAVNCTFQNNSAGSSGGGMYNYQSLPTVTNCTFYNNSANDEYARGGGMSNSQSSTTVTNCTFYNNSANGDSACGGGMHNSGYSPVITNCIFRNNSANGASAFGGGMSNDNSTSTITNCTFYNNSATDGGGIYKCQVFTQPDVTNCILWGDIPDEIYITSGTINVNYSDVQGGYSGDHNIDLDPLFINAPGGNFHLNANSPCIDTGNNASVPAWLTTDLDGNTRIVDGNNDTQSIVDMGAYEYVIAPAPMIGISGGGDAGSIPLSARLWLQGNGRYWEVTLDGILMENAVITFEDGSVVVSIPAGTKALGSDGKPLSQISVNPIDPPPAPEGTHILAAFSFQPSGATFSPGIQITIAFDPSEVAEGETVAIAFFNEATQSWEIVEGTVGANGIATFDISHFTVFAVMADEKAADQSAGDGSSTPAAEAPAASSQDSGGLNAAEWIGIAIGIIAVIAILFLLFLRWRRSLEQ